MPSIDARLAANSHSLDRLEGAKMAVDVKKIGGAVLELERSLNERWSAGDCHGYLDNYHDDISYFDPVVERLLVGRESVVEHLLKLYKNPHIERSEYLNPHVIVSNGGDLAVLSYNLNTFDSDEAGCHKLRRAWNTTEVYRLVDGQWRIVHSNWALTKSSSVATAS
jgi:ketosteroid isomerase-like protein